MCWNVITKTRLYNFDPLKPHFYIVKLGFTGVYIIFLMLLKNIDCGYSLEPPRRGGSNKYPQSMFWAEIWKNIRIFYLKIFIFCWWNFQYIEKACFCNVLPSMICRLDEFNKLSWHWPFFQGHRGAEMVKFCLKTHFNKTNGWSLVKLGSWYNFGGLICWLYFGDLDQNVKVTKGKTFKINLFNALSLQSVDGFRADLIDTCNINGTLLIADQNFCDIDQFLWSPRDLNYQYKRFQHPASISSWWIMIELGIYCINGMICIDDYTLVTLILFSRSSRDCTFIFRGFNTWLADLHQICTDI